MLQIFFGKGFVLFDGVSLAGNRHSFEQGWMWRVLDVVINGHEDRSKFETLTEMTTDVLQRQQHDGQLTSSTDQEDKL